MIVEHIKCTSGDWNVLKLNGKVYHEAHSIPEHIWKELLLYSSGEDYVDVFTTVITEEQMEEGNY